MPVYPVKTIHEDHLSPLVEDRKHGEVLDFRKVEARKVHVGVLGLLPPTTGTLPHMTEDLAASLEELAAELLTKYSFRQALALGLDLLAAEKRALPGGTVPALVVQVLARLTAPEKVVEPAFALRCRYQERPTLPVDQALGEVALPDCRLESRRLVDDEPVESFAEERDGVVRALAPDLAKTSRHIAKEESLFVVFETHDAMPQVLSDDNDDLAEDLVGKVIGRRDHPADRTRPRYHRSSQCFHGGAERLAPSCAAGNHSP